MAPSSSGLGHRAFIPVIAGSNPAGVTESNSVRTVTFDAVPRLTRVELDST